MERMGAEEGAGEEAPRTPVGQGDGVRWVVGDKVWYWVTQTREALSANEEGLRPGWHPAVVQKVWTTEIHLLVGGRTPARTRKGRLVRKRVEGEEPPGSPSQVQSQAGNGGRGGREPLSPQH